MGMTTNLKTTLRTCFQEHRGNIDLTEKKKTKTSIDIIIIRCFKDFNGTDVVFRGWLKSGLCLVAMSSNNSIGI